MLFGQSVFQSVLTRLKEERGEEEAQDAEPGFRIQGLGTSFVAPTDDGPAPVSASSEAYFAFLPELATIKAGPGVQEPEVQEQSAPQIPPHLLRLSLEEIAEELAITGKDTEASLAEKRRQFAKANHPDGVAPEFRDNANIRMKTANLLIDTAMKQLYWR